MMHSSEYCRFDGLNPIGAISHAIFLANSQPKAELYLVGGTLRDLVMDEDPVDFDFAFSGSVAQLCTDLEIAYSTKSDFVFTTNPVLDTAHVTLSSGLSFDIATTRVESYSPDSAYPHMRPGPLEWDLARRDFTINAMALRLRSRDGVIVGDVLLDPYAGRADIAKKVIRVLHDESFIDDPTRILRALRFAFRFGFALEPHTHTLLANALVDGEMDKIAENQLKREGALFCKEIPAEQRDKWLKEILGEQCAILCAVIDKALAL